MSWFYFVLTMAAGYALRHFDILRIHMPIDPVAQAMKDAQELQSKKMAEEFIKKMTPSS